MSASRTASRPASRPASFYIGSRLAYDVATQDFIDRALALDSTAFDLTASNSLYTPGYVKAQWDALVRGLKADGAWNAITEWIVLRGLNWVNSGAFPKLKYDTTETNAYTSDFSAGVDSFTALNGAVAGNIDSIGGRNDNLRLTVDSTSNKHRLERASTLTSGQHYRLTAEVNIPSSNSHVDGVLVILNNNTIIDRSSTVEAISADTWTTIEGEGVADGTILKITAMDGGAQTYQDSGGDDVIYIRNVVLTALSPATVINSGFVTGDFDPIVGMTGDGTSYLDSGFWFPNFDGDDIHLGVKAEAIEDPPASTVAYMAAYDAGFPGTWGILNSAANKFVWALFSTDQVANVTRTTGHLLGTVRGVNDLEAYIDGVSKGTDTSRASTSTAATLCSLGIFARNRDDSTQDVHSSATLSHAHYGTGVTTAQALAISTRIAAFNAALA